MSTHDVRLHILLRLCVQHRHCMSNALRTTHRRTRGGDVKTVSALELRAWLFILTILYVYRICIYMTLRAGWKVLAYL